MRSQVPTVRGSILADDANATLAHSGASPGVAIKDAAEDMPLFTNEAGTAAD